MKESILHIELVDRPILGVCQSEYSTNSSGLDDGAECLVVINTGALSEAAEHPTSFVSVQGPVSVKLVFENPFSSDHVCLSRTRDEIPSMIVQESSILIFHGPTPMRVGKSITA